MKNRTPKRTMAIKMLSRAEKKAHVGPFDSKAWKQKEEARREKVRKAVKK